MSIPFIPSSQIEIATYLPAHDITLDRTLHFSSHNILLDETLTPRIADVGFVTPMPLNVGCTAIVTVAGAMTLAGSRGYLAPEFTDGKHGIKSDVYSYGVVSYSYTCVF